MKKPGLLFVVSGPSGVGKGTVCDVLLRRAPSVFKSVSATTRKMRPGEAEGVNYYYLTDAQFDAMEKEDKFLEHFEIYGNRYGTPREAVEKKLNEGLDVLLEIDVQGALAVKQKCPDALMIFLLPPSFEQLERRLRGRRTEDESAIRRRLAAAEAEMGHMSEYHYAVVNDDPDLAAERILRILKEEKTRPARGTGEVQIVR